MKLSSSEKTRLRKKYGNWAVVTGASSGIGLDLAERLAESGLNLVIISRALDSLERIALRLKSQYNVQIAVVAADLSDQQGIDDVIQATNQLDIGLLVASAGYGTSGLFCNAAIHDEVNMLRVNCEALLKLTHHFSKLFASKNRGGIILMSSMVAFQGMQLITRQQRHMCKPWPKGSPLSSSRWVLMY